MTYTADNWREAFDKATSCGFDRVDSEESAGPMGAVLADAYDKLQDHEGGRRAVNEDLVSATVEAAALQFSEWDTEMFLKVVDTFRVHYEDMDEPMQAHLDDHYPGFQIEWVKEDASIWDALARESEVWVNDENTPGIYVFDKVGR
ncbi:hypothetical protein [Streptomyces tubercidicus]|uniref:hypothetical protein n=1 Tax=Streptomyces tubercidicus TaxID=47759 RepID=UPI0036B0CDC3